MINGVKTIIRCESCKILLFFNCKNALRKRPDASFTPHKIYKGAALRKHTLARKTLSPPCELLKIKQKLSSSISAHAP